MIPALKQLLKDATDAAQLKPVSVLYLLGSIVMAIALGFTSGIAWGLGVFASELVLLVLMMLAVAQATRRQRKNQYQPNRKTRR